MVWKMKLSAQLGPTGWRFERYDEDCRGGKTSNTIYATVGPLHIFVSRQSS